jgi:hypothetical protein
MKTKKFEVKIYHTGFCSYLIEARNELEAVRKARSLKINEHELMTHLEPWEEADTIEESENYENNRK